VHDAGKPSAIRTEHRRLEDWFIEVGEILRESSDLEEARDSFAGLSAAIDVHFDQEDRLYYATIGALRPELRPEIQSIAEGHRRFRLQLAAIADQLVRADLGSARRGFAQLVAGFGEHEAAEERLLERVEHEAASPAGAHS
jgi:hypothetical protein